MTTAQIEKLTDGIAEVLFAHSVTVYTAEENYALCACGEILTSRTDLDGWREIVARHVARKIAEWLAEEK